MVFISNSNFLKCSHSTYSDANLRTWTTKINHCNPTNVTNAIKCSVKIIFTLSALYRIFTSEKVKTETNFIDFKKYII